MASTLVDIIKKGIEDKIELILTAKYGLGDKNLEVPFQPYIYGEDSMQYQFVWGYLSYPMLFYKFHMDNIVSAKLSDTTFTVLPNACYQYAIEEERYAVLPDFDNIYADAARQKKSAGK
jgi:hypothetical protein